MKDFLMNEGGTMRWDLENSQYYLIIQSSTIIIEVKKIRKCFLKKGILFSWGYTCEGTTNL